MSKLKILLFGEVNDQTETFVTKLSSLQNSKAGPFDVAFAVGICRQLCDLINYNLPIPVYLHQVNSLNGVQNREIQQDEANQCLKVKENLYVLRPQSSLESGVDDNRCSSTGIWSLKIAKDKPELVVVSCSSNFRADSFQAKCLLDKITHVSYRGCDLLFTQEIPQGAELLLQGRNEFGDDADEKNYLAFIKKNISYDIADIALKARARYHSVPSCRYHQSAPFSHLASITSSLDQSMHVGRIIALAPVSMSKDKSQKFVHALGLTPLLYQTPAEREAQRPANLQPCPYTDAAYEVDNRGTGTNNKNGTLTKSSGLSEASARRILGEERQKEGIMRWAKTQKRPSFDDDNDAADSNNTTLFLHGLQKDVTGQLQTTTGDSLILEAFRGAQAIRRPPAAATSSFCFVDFPSHALAQACVENNSSIVIHGVELTVKWANRGTKKVKTDAPAASHVRLTESDAKDSSSIYFNFPNFQADAALLGEVLRKWAEEILEEALADDDNNGERLSAENEPALRVLVRIPASDKHFGFLDFASHAAASMVLATLTGNTDGGQVLEESKERPTELHGVFYLHWARPKQESEMKDIIQDASGFAFERKHFPADAREDCWFCLASNSCEKHLIIGVFDSCYATMPKGPIHEGHTLIVPVRHTSDGVFKDPVLLKEFDELKTKLRQHAELAYDMDLFVFERAIQTKGGYHTHVQCVPVQRNLGIKLRATLLAQARRIGIEVRELNSDLTLAALLKEDEGYFYAEVPTGGMNIQRFLCVEGAESTVRVPLQFGREVLAAVLGKPEFAHWKSSLLNKEKESEMAAALRTSIGHS